ncbi:MAG TPA: glycosyltransferase family 2 protein, partial [Vicinamibacterales bacterium]
DADDVPAPTLLAEHVEWHRRYADPNCAVLGYTALSADLHADPLMHFVTEVDTHLFSYGSLTHGQTLDFSGFWGGRTSCKRSFLLDHGVFDHRFTFGCEDIELAFRLSKHGLRVIYNQRAVTTMVRAIGVTDFCARLWRQGRSNYLFSRTHPDPAVQRWTEADRFNADGWTRSGYDRALGVVQTLDRMARRRGDRGLPLRNDEWSLLHAAYREALGAAKHGGFLEAQCEERARRTVIGSEQDVVQSMPNSSVDSR